MADKNDLKGKVKLKEIEKDRLTFQKQMTDDISIDLTKIN